MGKLLIIDDLELNRRILRSLFAKEYEVLEAANGKEAIEVIEKHTQEIDVILLDLTLEDMTGFDILELGKQKGYFTTTPVVVITGSEQNNDQIRAFELGASDFIVTPLVPEVVLSRVNNVVTASKRIRIVEHEAQRLKLKAEMDEMTGLLNKTSTEFAIERRLKHASTKNPVMLVVDIDHFKTVNDTLGHKMGDHVIHIIADLLSSEFDSKDILGRIGGDEFCILIPDAAEVYKKINEMLLLMEHKPNITIPEYVTLSIGMAAAQSEDKTYTSLFQKADEALYHAKKAGKAQYFEYGTEEKAKDVKSKKKGLLLSHDRSIASGIHAYAPKNIELDDIKDCKELKQTDITKDTVLIIDVSDREDDAADCWNELQNIPDISFQNVYAICQEGSRSQYMTALQAGVRDLFMAPLDYQSFQRRMQLYLCDEDKQ